MAKEPFEKKDESLMQRMKDLRERNIPPEVLKGFSASVESRIREKEAPAFEARPRRSFVPVWVPALAILIVAVGLTLYVPRSSDIQLASANAAEISEEITTLKELGVWTEEDEKAIGVSENSADDLELTYKQAPSDSSIA